MIPRLLSITPARGALDEFFRAIRDGCGAQRHAVLLRRHDTSTRRLLGEGRELASVAHAAGAEFFVSSRVDIALALQADGLHLGEAALPPHEARRLFQGTLGVSRHDANGLQNADADYATLSPFAPSPKTGSASGAHLGPDRFAQLVRSATIPVLALGGIDIHNARSALDSGAYGLAAIRAITARGVREIGHFLDTAGSARE